MSLENRIQALKKAGNTVILAHYYVPDEVQAIADYVGDSYYLSKIARDCEADTILFCGVSFMGESAKILSPNKTVLMPDPSADCAMAHMADLISIQEMRKKYDDLAVVCYINSTAELKTCSDVCVTSANALKIIRNLPNKNIFFIPDGNLGRYIAEQIPEKNVILNDGYCPIHAAWTKEDVLNAKSAHPGAQFVAHPECTKDLLDEAEYIGSTSGIINYVTGSDCCEFIIGTEIGVLFELRAKNPHKKFYTLNDHQVCPDMKMITLQKVYDVLANKTNEVHVSEELREKSMKPLERMLELSK